MVNRSIVNALGFTTLSLILAGCGVFNSKPQEIEVSSIPVSKPQLILPSEDELNLRQVEWVILTPENFEAKIAEASESGRAIAFFALTDEGYENLGLNLSDLRAYIQQQQAIIAAYERYYIEAEETMDNAVIERL
jgi:hypothetical protein